MAIVSTRLRRRAPDVAAALNAPIAGRWGAPNVIAIATTEGDPGLPEAKALAIRYRAPLAMFAPGPLALAVLDRSDRALCYRLTGFLAAPSPAPSPEVDLRAALAELIALAAPGELRMEAGFDPADATLVWLDPYRRRVVSAERAIEIAGDILRHRARTSRRSVCHGVTRWKRRAATRFLDGPNGAPVFAASAEDAAKQAAGCGGRVVVWASRDNTAAERAATTAGVPLARLEDGFLRSVGLGAAFVEAASLVLDESGIYYDPTAPSDLETLLRDAEMSPALLARAARLRQKIVAANITKYNVGRAQERVTPEGRFAVLVPGQVEDDASILRGAGAVRTNAALLAAVRARRPDAFLVYKPHPDVVATYRKGAASVPGAQADAVVTDGAIAPLFAQCSAVETMTSLAGFEALLRGLEVTTHGQPFYAGWSLTEELAPHPRRGRTRTLDELVAAALILYPLYVDPASGLPCGPETALDALLEARALSETPAGRLGARVRRVYALARHRILGPFARRRA